MYNLFIGYAGPSDNINTIKVVASRFLEYTDQETQMRFRDLSKETANIIKGYTCLFMLEEGEGGAFFGDILDIVKQDHAYHITFRRDYLKGLISATDIKSISPSIGIDRFELNRTHWAIKQYNLLKVLDETGLAKTSLSTTTTPLTANLPPPVGAAFNIAQVFIVHGHDEYAKMDAKNYVESRGLEPIILDQQASKGFTIIEKIDHYSNVGFGIILYSECDMGSKRNSLEFRWRARQNVVFEHGYLLAKLSRSRVVALVKGDVETPNDISGVVYIDMDPAESWKDRLDEELRAAGYSIT
jgi:predicted nucleotide-binding protein